jgi:hypothetical protein
MRLIQIALFWTVGWGLFGCESKTIKDVAVKVQVVDEATGKPLTKAEVLIAGVYEGPGIGTSNRDSVIRAATDGQGEVEVLFKQVFKVGVAAQAPGYLPGRVQADARQPTVILKVLLRPQRLNPTLTNALHYDLLSVNDEDFKTIASQETIKAESGKPVIIKMDYCYHSRDFKTPDSYGVIMSGLQTSRNTAACDFWLEPLDDAQKPNVLIAGGNGGIIPLFNNDYYQSALFNFDEAPVSGYQKKYVLTGKESGFFIKARDGLHYGKYVLNRAGAGFNAAAHGKNDSPCEYWWEGSCLYQPDGSRNLRLGAIRVNLTWFLRGSIP